MAIYILRRYETTMAYCWVDAENAEEAKNKADDGNYLDFNAGDFVDAESWDDEIETVEAPGSFQRIDGGFVFGGPDEG